MRIAVVIPSYRSSATIVQCIESVRRAAAICKADISIIVADSSDDDTPTVLEQVAGDDVCVVRLAERAFPGAARNRGVEQSNGDVIAFLDADAVADRKWLVAIEEFFEEHPDVAVVGGPVLNANPQEGWSKIAHWCEFSEWVVGAPPGSRRFLPTVNMAVRRSAFERCGPFLEEQFGCEDVELGSRMQAGGLQQRWNPRMRIAHSNRTHLATIYAHMRKLGDSSGRARVRYRLKGSSLVGPFGAVLIPWVRTGLVLYRAATRDRAEFRYLATKIDKVFLGMSHYARGFRSGARAAQQGKGP